jgi:imidazolonepropionase-like amidohydrolase
VVSTLEMHAANGDRGAFEVAAENLRRFRAAGGRVLYGTDRGTGRVAPGISVGELTALAAIGVDNAELLAMCATGPLRPGAPADLVGLRGDPTGDLAAFGEVALVVRGEAILAARGEGHGG